MKPVNTEAPGSAAAPVDDDALRRFVEDVGMFMESTGVPRSAGRLVGWLLVCDPPEQSAQQLAEALGASSGGVSTNVRLLAQVGLVERVGLPDDRRTHYRIKRDAWSTSIADHLRLATAMRGFADEGLGLLAAADPSRRERLRQAQDYFAFMERELPALGRRYDEDRRSREGEAPPAPSDP
ncbi:MarR family protein [Sediminihabitans luteus]|uniref:MarR family protein n=1 Tax=Sediminihabitans luteus TaxID=1138585 RepID=A0A2M9CD98_9CELL|nr:MarR family protein [Sediminihabitans luteus]